MRESDTVAKAKTRRVQMDLSEGSFDRLQRLKELADVSSYSEIMRDAIRLYEFLLQEDVAGSKFHIEGPEGKIKEVKLFLG